MMHEQMDNNQPDMMDLLVHAPPSSDFNLVLLLPEDVIFTILDFLLWKDYRSFDSSLTSHKSRPRWNHLRDSFLRNWKRVITCERVLENYISDGDALITLADGRIAASGLVHNVKLWNATNGTCEKLLIGHRGTPNVFIQLNDGRLATGSWDSTIKIWDISIGVCDFTLAYHSFEVISLLQLHDGRLVSGSYDCTMRIWNIKTGARELRLTGHGGPVCCLLQLLDGRLASASYDGSIKVWHVESGRCDHTFRAIQATSRGGGVLIQLMDGRIASGTPANTIKIWNVTNGVCELTLAGHCRNICSLIVLKDGRVASGSWDRTIKIWNVTDGVCEQTIEGRKNIPPRLLFQLQDGRLISSSYHNTGHDQKKGGGTIEHDSTIRVWNLVDGQCELTLAGHVQRVHGLVELSDGRIASASDVYTMRIWNIKG